MSRENVESLRQAITAFNDEGTDAAAALRCRGRTGIRNAGEFVREGFKDRRAFDELVRASEGVPRDAINIAAKAGMRASDEKISVEDVRVAAQSWFASDKEAALRSREDATLLLRWIIDQVIRGKRS